MTPSTISAVRPAPTTGPVHFSARWQQLDTLRAFAVVAVMLAHFSWTIHNRFPDIGTSAVRMFFVLSGFLITGILLQCRDRVATGSTTAGFQLRRFYFRRALRIFPAFYAVLLAAVVIGMGTSAALYWSHAFYAGNLYIAVQGDWTDLTAHLWSLAVEEQFYFFWPFVILFAPQRTIPWLIAGLLLVGLLSRLAIVLLFPANPVAYIAATPCCADQLGLGALLAWCWHTRRAFAPEFHRWRRLTWPLIAALPLLISWTTPGWTRVLFPFLQALAFAGLVDQSARGFTGPIGRLMTWRPLLWLGQISYGLYLVHNFAHWWGPRILRQLTHYQVAYLPNEFFYVLYYIGLSLLAATASWYLLEAPLNRLKNRFNY